MSRPQWTRPRTVWACCDACHAEHANRLNAWLHWLWLVATRQP